MKNISESIKKLNPESLRELSALFNLKTVKEKEIIDSAVTSTGIHTILSNLDEKELLIVSTLYSENNGISFRDIEKKTGLKIEEIDDVSNRLMNKLLVYRIKNRQLLTNKMDKLYCIKEISGIINLSSKEKVSAHLDRLNKILAKPPYGKKGPPVSLNNREKALLKKIMTRGSLLPFPDAGESSGKLFNKLVTSLSEKKAIRIIHSINNNYSAYLTVDGTFIHKAVSLLDAEAKLPGGTVNNRFFFLLNILNIFDTISTFGLFLTKQGKFRKIDKKRITDSLFRLKTMGGTDIPRGEMLQLIMHVMSGLGCLRMEKDIAVTTLKGLSDEIRNPLKFTVRIINSLKKKSAAEEDFPPPFLIPSFHDIRTALYTIFILRESEASHLFTMITMEILSGEIKKDLMKAVENYDAIEMRVEGSLNYLSLLGIIETSGKMLKLSEPGLKVAAGILGIKQQEKSAEKRKSIYINPDFTLIIPAEEIDSDALYFLLAYTDVVKYDFILHAVLSKNSIVKALKRGFDTDKFIEVLNRYSKNDIPQNLNYLLNEWTNQTIQLGINRVVIMKTSHPTFIEDILHSTLKGCILERISPHHAIIEISSIDDIVKFARKSDAVISLFGE